MSYTGGASRNKHSRGMNVFASSIHRNGGTLPGGTPACENPFPLADRESQVCPQHRSSGPVFRGLPEPGCRKFHSLRLAPDDPEKSAVVHEGLEHGPVLPHKADTLCLITLVEHDL